MPELPSQPSGEQQKWSAATAKDRIAIVTTDAALDARIRAALRDEVYEFVTVLDFVEHQAKLTDTLLGIFDAQDTSVFEVIKFVRMSLYWAEYGMIGIYTIKGLEEKKRTDRLTCGGFPPGFDVEVDDSFADEELVSWVKRLIKVLRESDD